MENHPIPQDITGFEFKLIGSMTLKQFAYLAGGSILAWIMYVLPVTAIIKIPLAVVFLITGAAFAFLPVDGRPLDVMISNFFRAIFRPTQYVYQKAGGELLPKNSPILNDFNKKRLSISEMSEKQLSDFLKALPKGTSKLDKKEMIFFQSLNQYGASSPTTSVPEPVAQHAYANTPSPTGKTQMPQMQPDIQAPEHSFEKPNQDLQKTAEYLQKELVAAKAREKTDQVNSSEYLEAHKKVLDLQKNLNDLLFQKQQLETRLISLQKQMETQGKQVYSPTLAQEPQETKQVRSVPQSMASSVGLPSVPEFPNLITGIIKDPRGNPLTNILVEVKDSQGNAVRAFKTNALGHFASATPLNNGDYTIDFEDPAGQNKFVSISFRAEGKVILPIEVISTDSREELRRTLFTN